MRSINLSLGLAACLTVSLASVANSETVTIVADAYDVTTTTTGFALDNGVNFGINPPATRLVGTAAANLRYLYTTPDNRSTSKFGINSNRLRVMDGTGIGRFTLSGDGLVPYDFAGALGVPEATAANPVTYDVKIAMRNDATSSERMTFGLATVEGDVTILDFGVQLVHASTAHDYYTIYKRVDTGSAGVPDVNAVMTNTAAGTYKALNHILLRVTDAGAETGENYHSRVQVSLDDGATWVYDTRADTVLPNGFRFDAPGRFFVWDQAPNPAAVFYDNFSVTRTWTVAATPVSPSDGTTGVGPSVALSAGVSNTVSGDLTVTFYGRQSPKPYPGPDFCIAVLPDTQNYAREAAGNGEAVKEMWFAQTDWIVNNRVSHNIVYVAHLGDITQNGDIKNGNQNLAEWRNATNAMYRLENPSKTGLPYGIPYGMAVGNHDQEPIGDENGTTSFYNQYFGVSRFSGRPYYGGNFGDNNDSHYDVFRASGLDFIVFYFEYGRYGSSILNWANDILAAHPNHHAIAVTHHAGSDKTPSSFSAQGSAIFNALKVNTNFFMMLGGHVAANGGEGSRVDTYLGRKIRTFISDFQGWMNGGNGFMRLMYFSPSNSLVTIKTYSPWLNEYRTDANSEMTFTYKMPLPTGPGSPGTPYVALATNVGVAPASLTSCTWSGLLANKTYDWYVRVEDDEGNVAVSKESKFVTLSKFAPNSAPVATSRFTIVTGDEPVAVTLEGSDVDNDPLTFEILSEPLNGLVGEFDAETGAMTYLPVRGYRGPDRVTFRANDGFTNSLPSTLTLSVVAPPDADGDGLPDGWAAYYGVTASTADGDGDGLNNLGEYMANTNPTNAASNLRISSLQFLENGDMELQWSSVGGSRYRVEYSDAETGGGPAGPFQEIFRSLNDEIDTAPYGAQSSQSYSEPAPTTGSIFYRVRVVQ